MKRHETHQAAEKNVRTWPIFSPSQSDLALEASAFPFSNNLEVDNSSAMYPCIDAFSEGDAQMTDANKNPPHPASFHQGFRESLIDYCQGFVGKIIRTHFF